VGWAWWVFVLPGAAALLLAALAGPAAAAAGGRGPAAPPRVVEALVRARSVAAGGSLVAVAALRGRERRSVRPRVAVDLVSAVAGGRVRLGEVRLRRLQAGAGRHVRVELGVPGGVQAGSYRVRLCARAGGGTRSACARAGRVRVSGGPPAVPPRFVPGARSGGDDLYPAIGNGGYDALAYRLDVGYRPVTRVLHGRARMTAAATRDLRSFSLDLQGLAVRAVGVDGRPAFFRHRRTKLIVTPTAGIRAGARMLVSVAYGGVVRPAHDPSSGPTGWLPTRTGATVASQPIGAQNWFPSNNIPADKALFDVSTHVPTGLEVLGNGRLVSRRRTGASTTFRWVENHAMATYLVTATLGRYAIVRSRTPSGLPLYSGIDRAAGGGYGAPSRRQLARRRALLSRVGAIVDRLATLLGPYPFDSAGGIVANAPDLEDALETQTRPVYVGEFDPETQIHELAHQWFGDDVTATRSHDIWLHEGFATWLTWWARHRADPRAPTTARAAARAYRASERRHGHLRAVWRPVIVTRARDLFGDAVYDRGAMLLEALRQRVGNANFRRILRDWLDQHAYGNATTGDFIALTRQISGQRLSAFFDDWLHTLGKPRVPPPRARGPSAHMQTGSVRVRRGEWVRKGQVIGLSATAATRAPHTCTSASRTAPR
jgi:hypothetical protein